MNIEELPIPVKGEDKSARAYREHTRISIRAGYQKTFGVAGNN